MTSFSRLREESNQIGMDFLIAELETACTFLDVADTTTSSETRDRNRKNARVAYDTVIRLKARVIMDQRQKATFERKLADLKDRLDWLGLLTDE